VKEIGGDLTCENLVAIANSEELASQPKKPGVHGERFLTWAAIAACLCSLLLLYRHLTNFALEGGLTPVRLLLAGCTAFLVTALVYGSLVYLFARVGYLRRKAALVQPSRDELETVYNLNKEHPRVCILIPTYREEIRVLRQTILSAALSEYPSRRIAVLIDDPPEDSAEALRALVTTRCLVADLNALFREAANYYRAELSKFIVRFKRGEPLDLTSECRHLADLYEGMADWIEALVEADEPEVAAHRHTSEFFRARIILAPAAQHRSRAKELRRGGINLVQVEREYRRLGSLLFLEITHFERKQFSNLSHAPNKAMNLNSYIALIGKSFRVVPDSELPRIEECALAAANIIVPEAEFILTLDADSLILSDYILKLAQLMNLRPKAAVVQTPYSAIPGSRSWLQRAAGAQTDMQYIIHQGFTHFGATYWVGANALLRLAALRDIQQTISERGYPVQVFIQDRTVIEDTGSTIDLVRKGWYLHNHPERLAYSATPPDFGSLIIQRRRWANGGLIIFPDLLRYAVEHDSPRPHVSEIVMRAYYLCSPAITSLALILLPLKQFGDGLTTIWAPCTALPYFVLYARDLRLLGYAWADLPRVYALNLMLLPINLTGVIRSIQQMLLSRRSTFGRTPKIEHRTPVPPIHVLWQTTLVAFLVAAALLTFMEGRYYFTLCWAINAVFVFWGFKEFLGFQHAWRDVVSRLAVVSCRGLR
jgi:cellulose synthase (UDP-forming)